MHNSAKPIYSSRCPLPPNESTVRRSGDASARSRYPKNVEKNTLDVPSNVCIVLSRQRTGNGSLPVLERLEELVWIDEDGLPGRLDMCECERLLQCPNGTISALGSKDIYSCEVRVRTVRKCRSRELLNHLEHTMTIARATTPALRRRLELVATCIAVIWLLLAAPWCGLYTTLICRLLTFVIAPPLFFEPGLDTTTDGGT